MNESENPVLETMAAHRTIRRYAQDPVPGEDIRRALEAARMASTSSNVQGYSVLQVTDAGERARLVELTGGQPQVAEAGAFLCILADQRTHRLAVESEGAALAPNLETFLVDVVDAALLAQNLALAFESMGYGICFIGGLRTNLEEVDRLLELPPDVFPLFGLCVGVRAEDPAKRPRLPLEAILHVGRFGTREELAARVVAYDEEMARYYAERGAPGRTWSSGLARKLSKPRREGLAAYYAAKGVRLR